MTIKDLETWELKAVAAELRSKERRLLEGQLTIEMIKEELARRDGEATDELPKK